MNIKTILLLLLTSTSFLLNAQKLPKLSKTVYLKEGNSACEQTPWKLVFQDEFDGKKLNTDKWHSYYPYGEGRTQDCEFCRAPSPAAHIYRDENLVLEDGMLKITCKEESGEWYGQKRDYTAGLIYSDDWFHHGKFEMRCKIPAGKGFIPSFWLWGKYGEIDIFEFGCHKPDKHFMTIHMYPDGEHFMDHEWYKGPDFSADFHTFTLEWEPRQIIFKVDGKPVKILYRYLRLDGKPLPCPQDLKEGKYIENGFFPQGPLHVLANVTVSSGKENSFTLAPNKKTVFPATFEVDYIRVYQR